MVWWSVERFGSFPNKKNPAWKKMGVKTTTQYFFGWKITWGVWSQLDLKTSILGFRFQWDYYFDTKFLRLNTRNIGGFPRHELSTVMNSLETSPRFACLDICECHGVCISKVRFRCHETPWFQQGQSYKTGLKHHGYENPLNKKNMKNGPKDSQPTIQKLRKKPPALPNWCHIG